jgi:hypothetical protein
MALHRGQVRPMQIVVRARALRQQPARGSGIAARLGEHGLPAARLDATRTSGPVDPG